MHFQISCFLSPFLLVLMISDSCKFRNHCTGSVKIHSNIFFSFFTFNTNSWVIYPGITFFSYQETILFFLSKTAIMALHAKHIFDIWASYCYLRSCFSHLWCCLCWLPPSFRHPLLKNPTETDMVLVFFVWETCKFPCFLCICSSIVVPSDLLIINERFFVSLFHHC